MKKKLMGAATLALALATTVGCAARIHAHYGPPPPPPPRGAMVGHHRHGGMVWVPGHYRWTGRGYVWVEGHWVRPPRPGHGVH